jgi:hypothetical protein
MHSRTPLAIASAALLLTLALLHVPVLAQQAEAPPVVEEPTEAQIVDAYRTHIASINARSRELLGDIDGGLMELTVEDLKKLNCRAIDRVGVHFDCRVELRMKQAQRRPKTDVVQLWLSYEDDRWVAR